MKSRKVWFQPQENRPFSPEPGRRPLQDTRLLKDQAAEGARIRNQVFAPLDSHSF
jgi:hypothetical protein